MIIAHITANMVALGMKAYHHHFGVLPSAMPAMASEIQPIGRWLATRGTRSSSGGGGGSLTEEGMTASAIIALLSRPRHLRRFDAVGRSLRHDRLRELQTGFHFYSNTRQN